jgi:hypothetical protein
MAFNLIFEYADASSNSIRNNMCIHWMSRYALAYYISILYKRLQFSFMRLTKNLFYYSIDAKRTFFNNE